MIQVHPYDTLYAEIAINAPAERVFEAFVSAQERMKWWAHHEWVATSTTSDARPGGSWQVAVRGNGQSTSARGEYIVVDSPRMAVFTWLPDWYEKASTSLVRVDVEANGSASTLRITHSGLISQADREGSGSWSSLIAVFKSYVENR